jgi:polyisoprenoid-binding protein YceI
MKYLLTIFLAYIFSICCKAQKPITVESISINFIIKNAGINTNGAFQASTGTISFDPKNVSESKISGAADPATIKTGITIRDRHLKKSDYFDVEQYPAITMVSSTVKSLGGNKYSGVFNLTIKNTTKRMTIPFTYSQKGNKCLFTSAFSLNRLEFGLGEESLILSNVVNVKVEIAGNL